MLLKLKKENMLDLLFITGENAMENQQLNWKHLLKRVIKRIDVLEIKLTRNVTLKVMLIVQEVTGLKAFTNSNLIKQHQRVSLIQANLDLVHIVQLWICAKM